MMRTIMQTLFEGLLIRNSHEIRRLDEDLTHWICVLNCQDTMAKSMYRSLGFTLSFKAVFLKC